MTWWAIKFKSWSRDIDHAHFGVVCYPKANTWYGLPVHVQKFEDVVFSRSTGMNEDPKT